MRQLDRSLQKELNYIFGHKFGHILLDNIMKTRKFIFSNEDDCSVITTDFDYGDAYLAISSGGASLSFSTPYLHYKNKTAKEIFDLEKEATKTYFTELRNAITEAIDSLLEKVESDEWVKKEQKS